MKHRWIRSGAVLLVAVSLSAACGQKPSATEEEAATDRGRAPAEQEFGEAPEFEVEAGQGPEALLPEVPDPALAEGAAVPDPAVEDARAAAPASPAASGAPAPAGRSAAARRSSPAAAPARSGSETAPDPSGSEATGERPRPASAPAPRPESNPAGGSAAQPSPQPSGAPVPEEPPPAPTPTRRVIEGPEDRTGVTKGTIRIGVHAPVTGAAPFPQSAFEKSKDLYWKHLADKGGVWGRNVEVVFRDDEFNPTKAVQVCREMVEEEKVFALIGAAGSDQITACARYAESAGVPYFSAGVNEDGLSDLNLYFAVSQTYSQQSDTLVSLIKNKLKQKDIAIVVASNTALNEALRNFTFAATQAGLNIVRSSRVGKTASDAELLSEANQLKNSGADVVYVLMSPVNFIKLATNAQAQAYTPNWVGPGLTNGFQIVAQAGCPSIGTARFLNPFPQLDAIDDLDPDYRPAYTRHIGGSADDIGILQWGLAKTVHQVLEATGADLSRQSFLATLTSGKTFKSNVYPDVRYDKKIRFGASTAHLLEADCSSRTWKTAGRFVARADF